MHKLLHYIFAVIRDQKSFAFRSPEDHKASLLTKLNLPSNNPSDTLGLFHCSGFSMGLFVMPFCNNLFTQIYSRIWLDFY